ncbi:putative lipid II flippase FtsW [Limnobacter sp.]|uniref:putative lipid II flippase FtsW n=1 Tax=Limnobacter sp. TaxID=2003368 RepID=UPI00258AFE36|nr:putative lipid II flippase FtsW [Limnobacter sp.]
MLKWFKRPARSEAAYTQNLIPAAVSSMGAGGQSVGSRGFRILSAQDSLDQGFIWAILALLCLGLVMVYSATVALPDANRYSGYETTYFLVRHAFSIGFAFVVSFFVFQIPMKTWQQLSPLIFLCCLVLLMIVLIPGIGRDVNGSRRWLSLYIMNIQPSELAKVAAVLYAADYAVRKQQYMQRIGKVLIPMVIAMFLVGMLLLLEPDMGAFIVIVTAVFGILFLAGINARVFFGVLVMLSTAFAALIAFSSYRRARLLAYLDPWSGDNAMNKAYQLSHSLIAFGRGEIWGVGLGGSIEKLHYLPEAHTDFLLAVVGEELGFVGVTVVILLFGYVVKKCFSIGAQAAALEKTYSALVAKGMGIWLGVQCFINAGVNLGVLPTKGLTLPLMSYGGSAILMNCVGLALVLRVDYENRCMMQGKAVS